MADQLNKSRNPIVVVHSGFRQSPESRNMGLSAYSSGYSLKKGTSYKNFPSLVNWEFFPYFLQGLCHTESHTEHLPNQQPLCRETLSADWLHRIDYLAATIISHQVTISTHENNKAIKLLTVKDFRGIKLLTYRSRSWLVFKTHRCAPAYCEYSFDSVQW